MPNHKTLSITEFKQELENKDTTLIDVRTLAEQSRYGVISDIQLHIDISLPDAADRIQKLPKTGKYLIYCWHGVRSKNVLEFMKSNGFLYAQDLGGGIDMWN